MNFLLSLIDFFWSVTPNRLKVHLLQNKRNFGFLDTSKAAIKMRLESIDSLNRLKSCGKEPGTIDWIDETIKQGDVLYDVGANVGAYSLYAAGVKKAKVYSFEPSPSSFKLLMENIQLNNLSDKIIPLNIPLSSSTGLKDFKYSNISAGSASHLGLENASSGSNSFITQPVLTIALDDLIAKYQVHQPNHMKIDVDGHELGILEGARSLLSGSVLRNIQIETSTSDKNYDRIKEILFQYGYSVKKVNSHPNSKNTDIIFTK